MSSALESAPIKRDLAVAFLLPVVCLAPFLGQAYHIDDTFYLSVARQILEHPSDFYGFDISWGLLHGPAYESNKNPPGVSYLIAGVAALFGWREWIHHLVIALCAGTLSTGIYLIARRACRRPLLATVLAVLTPGFLVSSNTVMSDIPMLTLYVWAIWLWLEGLDRRNYVLLVTAALLIGLSTLTKYFGLTAFPLLAAYTLAKQRKLDPALVLFAIPIAMVVAYQAYAARLYGTNLLGGAADFALDLGWNPERFPSWAKPIVGLAFAGGTVSSLAFIAPWLWGRRGVLFGIALVSAAFAGILALNAIGHFPGRVPRTNIALYSVQYAAMIAAGLVVLALAITDLRRNRDAHSALLVLWLLGTLIFSVFINWTINVRTILPLIAPAAILAVRQLDARYADSTIPKWTTLAPALAGALALAACVLWADFRHAASAKTAAEKFVADQKESGRNYYFKGNWGFQYYMETNGIAPFNPQGVDMGDGDRIVVAVNNVIFGKFNPAVARAYKHLSLELAASRWIATNHARAGAGFYSHFFGALPFAFGKLPLEEYAVYELGDYEGLGGRGISVPIEFYEPPRSFRAKPE